ncbi:MAG: hypothetical protein J6X67_04780 [Treponema sp.]|nr:hypothetical protein [Treponema sp.]
MTPEEVLKGYMNRCVSSSSEKNHIMINLKNDLVSAGMDEDKAMMTSEAWGETNWSVDDWKEYYGVDSDSDLEAAMESD